MLSIGVVAVTACASGSDSIAVPGADAVVNAPGPTLDLPAVTDPSAPDSAGSVPTTTDSAPTTAAPATDPVATEPPETPAPTTATTAAAPVATDADRDAVFYRQGDEGPEVGLMQSKLVVLDYLPTGSETGVFDQATEIGLRNFQADYGLGVDGVFGPLTDRALSAAAESVDPEV